MPQGTAALQAKNDSRRTRTHAPDGVNLNTSVNRSLARRSYSGEPGGST
jgi:hypothetical protein